MMNKLLYTLGVLAALGGSVSADYVKIGDKVDLDLNIFSDKDLGWFSRGVKTDCIYMGKTEDNMYIFNYDGDTIVLPISSIKMIILKS